MSKTMPKNVARESAAVQFFWTHAGYGYDPKTETRAAGRLKCAKRLALAEEWARDNVEALWVDDGEADRSHFTDEYQDDGRPFFGCILNAKPHECPTCKQEIKGESASLWGIDLGETGTECPEYKRVVEAELALEMMPSA